MRRRFLWKPSNCREENLRISVSRARLKRYIKELYPKIEFYLKKRIKILYM